MELALRVCESVAFAIHCAIGLTEPCHHIGSALAADSLPMPNVFFPVAGACLALVAAANFGQDTTMVLVAQAYVAAFHSGAVYVHWRVGHHPVAGVGPGFFVALAGAVVALRTTALLSLVLMAASVGAGALLGVALVRPQGWASKIKGGFYKDQNLPLVGRERTQMSSP